MVHLRWLTAFSVYKSPRMSGYCTENSSLLLQAICIKMNLVEEWSWAAFLRCYLNVNKIEALRCTQSNTEQIQSVPPKISKCVWRICTCRGGGSMLTERRHLTTGYGLNLSCCMVASTSSFSVFYVCLM